MSNFDGFGDVIENESGIFAESQGLDAYDSVRHSVNEEGLLVEVHCEGCGFPRQVMVTYPELIAIRYNLSPHEAYQNHPQLQQYASQWRLPSQRALQRGVKMAWMPAGLRCRCGVEFCRPHIVPGEVDGHLARARQNGFINNDWAKPLANHCFQIARQNGRM